MRKIRGFRIGKRLYRVSTWIFRRTRPGSEYHRIKPPQSCSKLWTVSKILTWGERLTNGARALCLSKPGTGYMHIGAGPNSVKEKQVAPPKGHLAVYVGQKEGDFHRVLVPVIYFNHPLFGELLRESEEEYGFQHQGGITIPCGYSEFERVQTRIRDGSGAGKLMWKARCSGR